MSKTWEYIQKHPKDCQRLLGIDYEQLQELIEQQLQELIKQGDGEHHQLQGEKIYNLLLDEAQEDDEEVLNVFIEGLNFAKICVSLWAHCCIADGELSEEEDEITHELMGYLSTDESLFPEEIANQEAVLEELTYTFNNALPMKTIIQFGKRDGEIARNFYEEACLVFVADGVIASEERKFLEHLAQEWDISPMDQKLIEEQYLERLANGKAD